MSGDLAIRVELTVDDFWRPSENSELLRSLWLRSCVVYRHPRENAPGRGYYRYANI